MRSALLVALATAATILLGACDFLLGTAFPPFMAYVAAEVDLGARLPERPGDTDAAVIDTVGGERLLTLFVEGKGDPDAFVVADRNLKVLVAEESRTATETDSAFSFDGYTVALADGSIQRGNLIYDPSTNVVTNGAMPDLSLYPEPPQQRFPIPDGYLELEDDRRLVRLDPAFDKVDSFDLFHDNDDPGNVVVTVDPSGSAYYLVRVDAGILYKVDPWW